MSVFVKVFRRNDDEFCSERLRAVPPSGCAMAWRFWLFLLGLVWDMSLGRVAFAASLVYLV